MADSEVLRNRHLRVAAKRWHSLLRDILQTIKLIQYDFLTLSEQKKDT